MLRCYLIIILLLSCCFAAGEVRADIYRYIAPDGRVSFTNVPSDRRYRFYREETSPTADNDSGGLDQLIRRHAAAVSVDQALLKAMIKVESNFDPRAESVKGARGLMQLMPATIVETGVTDPFSPTDSIRGGSRYLRRMLDIFNGNIDDALAAYNAGPETVRRYGGVPPYAETKSYIDRVKHYYKLYSGNKEVNE